MLARAALVRLLARAVPTLCWLGIVIADLGPFYWPVTRTNRNLASLRIILA